MYLCAQRIVTCWTHLGGQVPNSHTPHAFERNKYHRSGSAVNRSHLNVNLICLELTSFMTVEEHPNTQLFCITQIEFHLSTSNHPDIIQRVLHHSLCSFTIVIFNIIHFFTAFIHFYRHSVSYFNALSYRLSLFMVYHFGISLIHILESPFHLLWYPHSGGYIRTVQIFWRCM